MLYVSIFVELVRARPALAVWLAAIFQALLWALVPCLFYSGPPGELPFVLAVGHEFQLGTYLGPPLAFWLAEGVYDLFGLIGIYVLSQICVVATYWAVFALGRSIVGAQHAALAVLLMVGISTFTVPTPDFGPVILTMVLWAAILLDYWRAVGEGSRGHWVALAVEIGLLLLTTYAGLLLVGLLVLFTLMNKRARATLRTTDPWFAVVVAAIVMFPHLLWIVDTSHGFASALSRLRTPESVIENFTAWLRQMAYIVAAHGGLFVLIALVIGFPWAKRERAPVIVRRPVDTFARQYVYFFAIVPVLAGTCLAVLLGWSVPVGGIAPLVILSGLAVILASGDAIELSHEQVLISAWFGLLLAPPVMAVLALVALPWIGIDLSVNRPAESMASFFAENFERRVGSPPRIVAGAPRTAALIALGPSRPSLFLDATPEQSPWVTANDVKLKGAIVVWPTTDTAGAPPADIKARFPDLVPEVPRAFERPLQGQLPLLRIGWAIVRPQQAPVATPEAPTQR